VRPAATDLASGREIWLQQGPIGRAVRASIGMPGIFSPTRHDDRWLIDGGLVNPVPVSLARALGADIVIAVDLNSELIGRRFSGSDTDLTASPTAPAVSAQVPQWLMDAVGPILQRVLQAGLDYPSYFVALDWSLPFTKYFALTGEVYEGRALGIFSVAAGESVGTVGTAGEHGVLSRGGWAQAQFNINPKWQVNLAYGIDQPEASELPVGNRDRNQTYMGNLMYKLSSNVTFAWELRRFLTDFRNQLLADERGFQANLAAMYSF